jgi:hypothetical protein
MKRTLIQFDEDTYHQLRRRAFDNHQSISSVVRELVARGLETGKKKKFTNVKQFASVAAGRSRQGRLAPVSERHDEAFAEAIAKLKK